MARTRDARTHGVRVGDNFVDSSGLTSLINSGLIQDIGISDVQLRRDVFDITRERKGTTNQTRLKVKGNPTPIGPSKATTFDEAKPSNRTRNQNRNAGTEGGAIASPLTETGRTEQQRTVISDDGLFEVTVADATQIIFDDANGSEVVFNLSPPTT